MITIDSQIWIYYFDAQSNEHDNVVRWLEKILVSESFLLCSVVPIEVAHNLFSTHEKKKILDLEQIEQTLIAILALKNCHLVEIDQVLIIDAIKLLKKYRKAGIGGRDSLILASMNREHITTIATHDKNLLALNDLKRIDPVFDPPLELEIGEKFDVGDFKLKSKQT